MQDFLGIGTAVKSIVSLGKMGIWLVIGIILAICGLIREGYQSLDMFYPKYEIHVNTSSSYSPGIGLKVKYNEANSKIYYWEDMTSEMKDKFIDLGGTEEIQTQIRTHLNDFPIIDTKIIEKQK